MVDGLNRLHSLCANLSCSGYSSVAESIARSGCHFQASEYAVSGMYFHSVLSHLV
jgi:hypothetical protein